MDVSDSHSKIFINPEFKKAHINRNFLRKTMRSANSDATLNNSPLVSSTTSIHLNPAFLEKIHIQHQQEQFQLKDVSFQKMTLNDQQAALAATVVQPNPIIKHTKRKLIRASSTVPTLNVSSKLPLLAPLVKINKNKLVRSTLPSSVKPQATSKSSIGTRIVENRYKLINKTSQVYKLDRRPGASRTVTKPKSSIRRYSLIRTNSISPQKVVVTDRRLLKLRRTKSPLKIAGKVSPNTSFASQNKKLVMVNINGVLYRSSTNKLQVSTAHLPVKLRDAKRTESKERCLTIRGTKFLLDSSGTKLRKIPSTVTSEPTEAKLGRIDIGGLTYMPKTDGTFVRTDNHRTRTHLSIAKQKSIHMLTNKMRKCNIPCPIYRRVGKCAAFLRKRCPKLHDPKLIMICPKFLKGECTTTGCLLSHNVSLEKMPVCHFYLEGRCAKNDCPYLHKKVSEKERICDDFLKGFCPLANKCQRRHEFLCPEFDRDGVCARTKCPYPHGRKEDRKLRQQVLNEKSDNTRIQSPASTVNHENVVPIRRYYVKDPSESSANMDEQLSGAQKTQLKRMLGKVEKMKQGHSGEASSAKAGGSSSANVEEIEIDSDSDERENSDGGDEDDQDSQIIRRVKLGPLPSFIPI